MIELDGIARRMLLCPPDLNPDHLDALIADAGINAVVTDEPDRWANSDVALVVIGAIAAPSRSAGQVRARHGMADAHLGHLRRAEDRRPCCPSADRCDRRRKRLRAGPRRSGPRFYDIRRYGGLQIFLFAPVLSGGSMVLSDPHEALR
ncbi:hypothetical protein ACU4GH_23525 [Bradyrhizobium betae]